MEKRYVSTRGGKDKLNFYQSIVQGIASDGGLLVPDFEIPTIELNSLINLSYVDLSSAVLSSFVPEDGKTAVENACKAAYGSGLFPESVVPVNRVGDVFIAELFHGRTAAFKDMALSILPYLMTMSLSQLGEQRKVTILTATSGDTGKAALEGFKDVSGTNIIVFYPTDGVSAVQRQQMVSQEGENVKVVGIRGNFDDAQRAVKAAFADRSIAEACLENGVFLSSANSINIGRFIPQIVYYIWSYLELVRRGEIQMGAKINFCVPSGNFGNCLAGWIASRMGVPVGRFLVASNRNNILSDFFNSGSYDTGRPFYKTNAPAMDILVSSNLERLLWFMCGGDSLQVSSYMKRLSEEGAYEVAPLLLESLSEVFSAGWLDESQVLETIRRCWEENSYMLDTHTACGYGFWNKYRRCSGDYTPTVLMSTASPFKFPESVYKAISGRDTGVYEAMERLSLECCQEIPSPLKGIESRPVLHDTVIDKSEIPSFIVNAIKQ